MIEAHDRDGGPAFELYALDLEHKHVPETQLYAGLTRRPIFVPSVGHFRQGMLVSVPLHLDTLPGKPRGADLHDVLAAVLSRAATTSGWSSPPPTASSSRRRSTTPTGSNCSVYANEARRQAVLVARLDNLGKGASGAAVQNLSLMLGLDAACVGWASNGPSRQRIGRDASLRSQSVKMRCVAARCLAALPLLALPQLEDRSPWPLPR